MAYSTKMVLGTGTAGDRAIGTHDIDGYIGTTYFDMLMDKEVKTPSTYKFTHIMSKYRVAPNMNAIPSVRFFQLDWSKKLSNENVLNASFSKWAAEPVKSSAFVKSLWLNLYGGGDGLMPSVAEIIGKIPNAIMKFVPRTTKLKDISDMVSEMNSIIIPLGYEAYELTGNVTTGEEAQEYAEAKNKEITEKGRIPVIVCPGHIGGRSFSIPEIDVVILAYDGGSAATTGQNMSRTLTRGLDEDKVGNIISISIDPTREDKLAEAILETAIKVMENDNDDEEDIVDVTKRVLRTLNVLNVCDDGEIVDVIVDDYTQKILSSKNLSRAIGSSSDATKLFDNPSAIQKLLALHGHQVTLGDAEKIGKKGKTFAEQEKNGKKVSKSNKSEAEKEAIDLIKMVQRALVIIAENAHNMAAIADARKFNESLNIIAADQEKTQLFIDCFNIEPTFIQELVETKVVNGNLLDLEILAYAVEQEKIAEDFWA